MNKVSSDSYPKTIEEVGNGSYLYHFGIEEVEIADSFTDEKRKGYKYYELVVLPPLTDEKLLGMVKEEVVKAITEYDKSDNVNAFYLNGAKVWLEFNTRDRIALRLNAEKEANNTETTLWLGTQSITLDIDKAKKMLYDIEVYASSCYDNTARHKANVLALDSADKVMAYDYTTGYPDKLSF